MGLPGGPSSYDYRGLLSRLSYTHSLACTGSVMHLWRERRYAKYCAVGCTCKCPVAVVYLVVYTLASAAAPCYMVPCSLLQGVNGPERQRPE
ncbi:hypothetical protein F5Y03DRAFT_362776 [Xylaria venustula]|nr:hypothetical protein F5Y03DRAFT_362776 [Xylaria venustula]